jgi:hypothetical protein
MKATGMFSLALVVQKMNVVTNRDVFTHFRTCVLLLFGNKHTFLINSESVPFNILFNMRNLEREWRRDNLLCCL